MYRMHSLFCMAISSIVLCGCYGRVLDMSHNFDNNTYYWPDEQYRFSFEILYRGLQSDGYWYEGNQFKSGEHGGTHVDSPNHFAEGGWSMDEIPAEKLICPAVMVDIRYKSSISPDVNVTLSDILEWEESYGQVPENALVFQCSGWSDMYGVDKAAYWGNDREDITNFHFPGFDAESSAWLADERHVAGLAVDTPSLDYGPSITYPAHVAAMARNLFAIENAKDPCQLPPRGATAYVLGMKIVDGSGAPLRLVATWDDEVNGSAVSNVPTAHVLLSIICLVVCASS